MANLVIRVKFNGAPDLAVTGKVEKLADVRRLLRTMDKQLASASRVFAGLKEHKVEAVTVRPE
jgi:hypothetical protein